MLPTFLLHVHGRPLGSLRASGVRVKTSGFRLITKKKKKMISHRVIGIPNAFKYNYISRFAESINHLEPLTWMHMPHLIVVLKTLKFAL